MTEKDNRSNSPDIIAIGLRPTVTKIQAVLTYGLSGQLHAPAVVSTVGVDAITSVTGISFTVLV